MAGKGADRTNFILKILVVLLAVLSLALLIALIVVATRENKSEPLKNGGGGSQSGGFCPETYLTPSKEATRSAGLYNDLSKEEIIAVRDYILSQSSLNVTPFDEAKINDNYIYLIELQQPPKAAALEFLDKNGDKPERTARVVIYSGGKANPDVREYLVKPAGKPTSHQESTGPGKYPIPFNTRFADTKELAIMEEMIKNVTKHAFRLLNESYDGFTFWGCKDRCLTWGLSAPSTFKANQRKQWTWMMRDMIGFYIQPVGFEVLLDTGGNDPTQWHYDTNFNGGYNFYGGMPGSALILRTAATTYNYDYVMDYIFYPNGVLEVRCSASGYPQATFYTVDEEPYSNQVHYQLAGSMHDHIFNYKVDIDILGTENSYETYQVGLQNFTNPWFPNDYHVQKIIHRKLHTTEDDAVYHYNFNTPTLMNFINKNEKNKFGVHRGYRLHIRDMIKQMYPASWPVVKGAGWSLNQLHVTLRKETEEKSSSLYNQQDMVDPVVDFQKYVNGENIDNVDMVAWVTMGTMHIPHSEDIPNTATPGSVASFQLKPFNYFDEDPSMSSYDGVVIYPSKDGAKINTFGTPTKPVCTPKEKPLEFYGLYGDY